MYKLENNTIYLTRGDTLQIQLAIMQDDAVYTPVEGDSIRFALKRSLLNQNKTRYLDKEPLILKNIPIDTLILQLDSKDTASLNFGKYDYDIEITMANGRKDTFIKDMLYLEPEVH